MSETEKRAVARHVREVERPQIVMSRTAVVRDPSDGRLTPATVRFSSSRGERKAIPKLTHHPTGEPEHPGTKPVYLCTPRTAEPDL